MTDELRKIFEIARDSAADMWNRDEDHEVHPMWHAVDGNDENLIIATPWDSEEAKIQTVAALREFFAQEKVKRYAFICEAWVVQIKNPKPGDVHGAPSQHPDRREVLRILAEDRDGRQLSGNFFILRPEHGPPKLSPFEEHTDMVVFSGRMSGMLEHTR